MSGGAVGAFERAFSAAYEVEHVLASASGTAAYLAALLALDLRRGCEIILSCYTWPQLAAVPRALGYRVRLVDCDEAGRLPPERVQAAVTKKTGAIIACHLFGNPNDARALSLVADRCGLPLVEDCSQSLLAWQHGRRVGTWGAVGFASLGEGKILSGGEGGLLWTSSRSLHRRACWFSRRPDATATAADRLQTLSRSLSLRMHPAAALQAAGDLEDMPSRSQAISARHELLRSLLADVPGVRWVDVLPDAAPAWQWAPLLVEKRLARNALWCDKAPAFLLDGSRRCRTGRGIHRAIRFLESGRAWESIDASHIKVLARAVRAAAEG